jgi:hypothetical protein
MGDMRGEHDDAVRPGDDLLFSLALDVLQKKTGWSLAP